MRKLAIILPITIMIFFTIISCRNNKSVNHQLNNYIWHYTAGGKLEDNACCVKVDDNKNIYVAGAIGSSSIDFGKAIRNSKNCIFLLKFNSKGEIQWDYIIHKGEAKGIAIDKDENIYLCGFFNSRDINFGGGKRFNKSSTSDIFVVKLDKNGKYIWDYTIGGEKRDEASDIVINSDGKIFVSGYFESSDIDFGINNDKYWAGVFALSLTNEGKTEWVYTASGTSGDYCKAIDIDNDSNVYITGYSFSDPINFGGNDNNNVGNSDIFVVKLDKNGKFIWDKTLGGTGNDQGLDIKIDKDNNCYIAGSFASSTINFGGGTRKQKRSLDLYVLKLDKDANYLWDFIANTKGKENATGIEIDKNNNVYITGYYTDGIDFGKGERESLGGTDIFVIKLSDKGKCKWEYTSGSTHFDYARDIAIDDSGALYIAGDFEGNSINFSKDDSKKSKGNGQSDIFVLKLKP